MQAPSRSLLAGLGLSAAALVGLVAQEGYSNRAIIPVPGDVPTIELRARFFRDDRDCWLAEPRYEARKS